MKSAAYARIVDCVVGFAFVVGLQGCAHTTPPSPLPDSIQQQVGRIGVVARLTDEQKALGIHGTGRLRNTGRGASLGAAMGAGAGVFCYWGAIVCIPIGAAGGAVAGGVYGVWASEPWQEADIAFRTIVAELGLNRALPEHLVAFSRMHGYEITYLATVAQDVSQQQRRYVVAGRDGIDTVLEIQDITVNLVPAEYMVNPQRRLTLSARVQLIRTEDETALDDRVVIDKLGPALELNVWMENDAARFRQELRQASERLAEQIITDYFMLYPFPVRVTSGFMMEVHLKGLRPLDPGELPSLPAGHGNKGKGIRVKDAHGEFVDSVALPMPNEFRIMARPITTLQPTIRWEQFPRMSATYDLRIWQAGRLGPDALVYDRAHIKQASHKLESPLQPSSLYYWSVRAHFVENGKDRITEWSRRSVKPSRTIKILTAWIAALMPDFVTEGYYVFITPPSPSSEALRPAAAKSQWFPWGNWPLSAPDSEHREQPAK